MLSHRQPETYGSPQVTAELCLGLGPPSQHRLTGAKNVVPASELPVPERSSSFPRAPPFRLADSAPEAKPLSTYGANRVLQSTSGEKIEASGKLSHSAPVADRRSGPRPVASTGPGVRDPAPMRNSSWCPEPASFGRRAGSHPAAQAGGRGPELHGPAARRASGGVVPRRPGVARASRRGGAVGRWRRPLVAHSAVHALALLDHE